MSKQQKRISWPILIAIVSVLGALAFAAGRTRSGPPAARNHTDAGSPNEMANRNVAREGAGVTTLPQGPPTRGPVQNVRFTLYDAGIYPRETRIKKGLVAVAIEDRTGQTAGLMIQRENASAAIAQVLRFANHWRGRGQFRLEPGRYRVFDASRPANHAVLVVDP